MEVNRQVPLAATAVAALCRFVPLLCPESLLGARPDPQVFLKYRRGFLRLSGGILQVASGEINDLRRRMPQRDYMECKWSLVRIQSFTASTRRRLLEDLYAYPVDGVLLCAGFDAQVASRLPTFSVVVLNNHGAPEPMTLSGGMR